MPRRRHWRAAPGTAGLPARGRPAAGSGGPVRWAVGARRRSAASDGDLARLRGGKRVVGRKRADDRGPNFTRRPHDYDLHTAHLVSVAARVPAQPIPRATPCITGTGRRPGGGPRTDRRRCATTGRSRSKWTGCTGTLLRGHRVPARGRGRDPQPPRRRQNTVRPNHCRRGRGACTLVLQSRADGCCPGGCHAQR